MSRLRVLPYAGALLLVVGTALLVFAVLAATDDVYPVVLALAILAVVSGVLCVVFGLLLPKFERSAIPAAAILGAATAAGRLAPARVLSSRPTGISVGRTWEFEADVVVAPADLPAYRGIQYLRGRIGAKTLEGDGAIITVVRVSTDDPRVVMVKDGTGTDQSQNVPLDAPAWAI